MSTTYWEGGTGEGGRRSEGVMLPWTIVTKDVNPFILSMNYHCSKVFEASKNGTSSELNLEG